MTEPEGPPDTPGRAAGPTPEEISARLEALLKRTRALRVQQPVGQAPLTMTWPPPGPELDHFDLVDVPDDDRLQPPAPAASAPGTALTSATAPDVTTATAPVGIDPAPPFEPPDWSELRLRGRQEEPPSGAGRLRLLAAVLALATVGQAGYIWYLRSGATAPAPGRLRVDGPQGAEVRVDGRPIGPAPIEHVLEPGDYAVEVRQAEGAGRAERVTIGLGRTVVLLPLGDKPAQAPPPAGAEVRPAAAGGTPAPAEAVAGTAAARPTGAQGAATPAAASTTPPPPGALSAAHGAVHIESTPAGLPVTMEGRPRGMTPITIGQLRPGRHDVLVGGRFRQVDVTANTVTTLRVARP